MGLDNDILDPVRKTHIAATLCTRFGRVVHNPNRAQLTAAIQDMKLPDPRSSSASISSRTGHTLTFRTDGRMTLTDSSQKDWIYELRVPSLARALGLWTALADLDLDTLLSEPWDMQRADSIVVEATDNVFAAAPAPTPPAENAPAAMPSKNAEPEPRFCAACQCPMRFGSVLAGNIALHWTAATPARPGTDNPTFVMAAYRCDHCGDVQWVAPDTRPNAAIH